MPQTLCPKCRRSFRTQRGLEWHLERSHAETRQAMRGQDQPKEAETACGADREQQVQEKLVELDTRLRMVAQEQETVDARLKERAEKITAETRDKLVDWLEVRLSNLLRERVAPLEQRLSRLESEQWVLKTQQARTERRQDSLDRRLTALEPKRKVCTLPRNPHSL